MKNKVQLLFEAIKSADAWVVADSPLLADISESVEPNGNPENEVFLFSWTDGESEFSEKVTEEDLQNAVIEGNMVTISDPDGDYGVTCYYLVPVNILEAMGDLK
jgi:hypothetical protein